MHPELPSRIAVGRGNVVFVSGACFHGSKPVRRLRLSMAGTSVRLDAARMPRNDVFERAPASPSYRSGFWAFVPVSGDDGGDGRDGELRLEAELADGTRCRSALGRVELDRAPVAGAVGGDQASVAICMATFEPEIELFARQIESIRGQTAAPWTCVISDDCTSRERFEAMGDVVGDDPRFVVSRSSRRLGFYRNFERALGLAPAEARYVALSDQDDRWHPDKLEALRASLSSGTAQLAYSDARIVDAKDNVVAETYWSKRRNNHTNLASLLIANTITGAASLFRRELLDYALPFPDTLGTQYHDHWLGIVALSLGEVAYVDRPLYDYVQHGSAALGHAGANVLPTDRRARAAALREHGITGARRLVAGRRTSYFYEYCRLQVLARVALMRCEGRLSAGKRRALELLVRSERSPLAFLWLALRPLRRLAGRSETLSSERLLARGIVWRWLVELVGLGRKRPPRLFAPDASIPALDGGGTR